MSTPNSRPGVPRSGENLPNSRGISRRRLLIDLGIGSLAGIGVFCGGSYIWYSGQRSRVVGSLQATAGAASGAPEAGDVSKVVPEHVIRQVARGIGLVSIELEDGSGAFGSGWLAKTSNDELSVVTAKHLVSNYPSAIRYIMFWQPQRPDEIPIVATPQGNVKSMKGDGPSRDLSAVHTSRLLDSSFVPDALPYTLNASLPIGSQVLIAGFPQEFVDVSEVHNSKLYLALGAVRNNFGDTISVQADVDEGASGSAVLANIDGSWSVVGIVQGVPFIRPDGATVTMLTNDFEQLLGQE